MLFLYWEFPRRKTLTLVYVKGWLVGGDHLRILKDCTFTNLITFTAIIIKISLSQVTLTVQSKSKAHKYNKHEGRKSKDRKINEAYEEKLIGISDSPCPTH
jgi:hypothetical protein